MRTSTTRLNGFRAREQAGRELASACLSLVGLVDAATRTAGDLPYGEQKMLSVAVAPATKPKLLLLLDELAAGLNRTNAKRLAELLPELDSHALMIVLIDHNCR